MLTETLKLRACVAVTIKLCSVSQHLQQLHFEGAAVDCRYLSSIHQYRTVCSTEPEQSSNKREDKNIGSKLSKTIASIVIFQVANVQMKLPKTLIFNRRTAF